MSGLLVLKMEWLYRSSSNCANVAPTPSLDVSEKKIGFFQLKVYSAESNAWFSLSKASTASSVACGGETLSFQNMGKSLTIIPNCLINW